jgi:predicted aspartyl protease
VNFPFKPSLGTILVGAELTGPAATKIVVLALDTGASGTTINTEHLIAVGFDFSSIPTDIPMATGSGVVKVARISIPVFKALGQSRMNYNVLAHTLPATTGVDGVLGLDFFTGQILTLDFVKGEISLVAGAASATP